jgi:predicted Zn-dependent peptidase
VDHERFLDLVGPAFESICPGGKAPQRQTPNGRSLVEIHNRTLEQVQLCLYTKGLAISDPQRYAFSLLNTILGGNMSSRLFQAIRERHALAYTVYSFISSFVDTGVLGTYVGVSPEKAQTALNLILEEMCKLCEIYVDSSELRDAKEYTKGSLLLASESVDNQMVRLAQNDIHFGEYIPMKTVLEKIESVSEAELLELARDIFKKNHFALTLLGTVKNKIAFEALLAA